MDFYASISGLSCLIFVGGDERFTVAAGADVDAIKGYAIVFEP